MKKMLTTVSVVLLVLLSMQNGFAQSSENHARFKKQSLQNLEMGITSQNDGVRKSSIYLAGKYRIAELIPVLYRQLLQEKDTFNKRLILLSIYQVGDYSAINKACCEGLKDTTHSVRHLSAAMLLEIQNTNLASE